MVEISQFKDAAGNINWDAYKAAQRAAGQICSNCGDYISGSLFSWSTAGPRNCSACNSLVDDSEEVYHDTLVRCPHCRKTMSVADDELYDLYGDGEHDITCHHCDADFTVSTSISYNFKSPALANENDEEGED